MIEFLDRENTDAIRLHFDETADTLSKEQLIIRAKRDGKFNLGFHYILRKDGTLEDGISPTQYADFELDDYKTSIYVLVTADKLTDAAEYRLEKLSKKLKLKVVD